MNVVKKMITSILIVCMFLRLPESKAMASEVADNFISEVINVEHPIINSNRIDCTGLYTIFSPCYTAQIKTANSNVDGGVDKYDRHAYDQSLLNGEDRTLPWQSEYSASEPPSAVFLIPVIYF